MLDSQIGLEARILGKPHYLNAAVAAVESSAWRGSTSAAEALLSQVESYVSAQQRALQIVDPPRVTLGGKSGSVPVSITSHLRQPVTVILRVSAAAGDRILFGPAGAGKSTFMTRVTIPAGPTKTIKIPVQSAATGSTTLTIELWTPGPDSTPLPGETATMIVSATHFGTLALVIIGIAFGVFVLTSIGRAVRRGGGRPDGQSGDGESGNGAAESGEAVTGSAILPTEPDGPDTVGAERAAPDSAPEEPDEHVSARGRAEPR
jgi:hypothetical protein